jgi:hypothetical protein
MQTIIPSIAGCGVVVVWAIIFSIEEVVLVAFDVVVALWYDIVVVVTPSLSASSFDGVGLLLVFERLMTAENNVVLGEFFRTGDDDDISLPPLPR